MACEPISAFYKIPAKLRDTSPDRQLFNWRLCYLPPTSVGASRNGLCPWKILFSPGLVAHYPVGVGRKPFVVYPGSLSCSLPREAAQHGGL